MVDSGEGKTATARSCSSSRSLVAANLQKVKQRKHGMSRYKLSTSHKLFLKFSLNKLYLLLIGCWIASIAPSYSTGGICSFCGLLHSRLPSQRRSQIVAYEVALLGGWAGSGACALPAAFVRRSRGLPGTLLDRLNHHAQVASSDWAW